MRFLWQKQTALCDYEDKAPLFVLAFCFARNKVKEVIELTLSQQKKSKQKDIGKEKLSIDATVKKRLRKRRKSDKNLPDWNFYRKADIVYCIYLSSLTFVRVSKIIEMVFIEKS